MDISTYLIRLKYTAPFRAEINTLRGLQSAHLISIPFENLDIIPLHRPIQLNERALWDKIIIGRRGGFCYELNGIFAWLLKQIGFEVTYLNARVFSKTGELGMNYDHLALLVRAPGEATRWLADVGFGDSFLEPLNLDERGEQSQSLRAYRLEEVGEGWVTWQKNYDEMWERQYYFDLLPRSFPEDYEEACIYQQTSAETSFTQRSIITIATRDGRVSLEQNRLIITSQGRRQETPVSDENEYNLLLKKHFGVVLH
jgi:N-hydroxyarylamine O-acetyltransferase